MGRIGLWLWISACLLVFQPHLAFAANRFCAAVWSMEEQVRYDAQIDAITAENLTKTVSMELTSSRFSGISAKELYRAYLEIPFGEAATFGAVNSESKMVDGKIVRDIRVTTPTFVEAFVTMKEVGWVVGEGTGKWALDVEMDIRPASPRSYQVSPLARLAGSLMNTMTGAGLLHVTGAVRITFEESDAGPVIQARWTDPVKSKWGPAGFEMTLPTSQIFQMVSDAMGPMFGKVSVFNFGRGVVKRGRTAKVLNLVEKTEHAQSAGTGGFHVEMKDFIPGYTLKELGQVIGQLRIKGRHGVAGFALGNSGVETVTGNRKIKMQGGRVTDPDLKFQGNINIDLEILEKNQGLILHNENSGDVFGYSDLIIQEVEINGVRGLMLHEISYYRPTPMEGVPSPFGVTSSLVGLALARVHKTAYYAPSAIANLLVDAFGPR